MGVGGTSPIVITRSKSVLVWACALLVVARHVGGLLLLLLLLLLVLGLCAMADPERCLKKIWSGRKSYLSSLKLAL